MTTPAACFSDTYRAARARFLGACGDAGGEIASYRHPLAGRDGEPLFLDSARFGSSHARRVLFVASGTHGIEGFCGSGIQTFLLRRHGVTARLPGDVALVMLHALNPWGFAWLRRVNEDNVDLNRNFLAHDTTHPSNPDYDALDAVLNPLDYDDTVPAALLAATQRFEAERGWDAMYRALSGGQYDHPTGLQYGGRQAVWSNRTLRRIWQQHCAGAEAAVFVDLHSGLGPSGVGLLLQTAPADSVAAALAQACWSDVIRAEPAAGGDAALVSGLLGPAFVAATPHIASTGLVLEFGTIDVAQVMLAIQADNWLHHHGRRDGDVGRAIEQRMREAFFVNEDGWKEQVCQRAAEVVDRAIAGLVGFTSPAHNDATVVRAASLADLDVVMRFSQALAQESENRALDAATLRAGATAFLTDPARGRVFVVESAGTVVAALTLTAEWSDWRNGWFWWIQNVYVDPDGRRQGHYRRLHEHVRQLAERDPEVCGLRLYVEDENHSARASYATVGMKEAHYRIFEQPLRRG